MTSLQHARRDLIDAIQLMHRAGTHLEATDNRWLAQRARLIEQLADQFAAELADAKDSQTGTEADLTPIYDVEN